MADSATAMIAALVLASQSGAHRFEIGFLHENVPCAEAGWFAKATYRGANVMVSDQPGPGAAAEALARRIIDGRDCERSSQLV